MNGRIIKLAAILSACGGLASASSILFGLSGDPNQNYTFIRTDSPAGAAVTEAVGPYPGWLGQNITADDSYFFCITFTNTANWGGTYEGTLRAPSTQAELEAAYLVAELYGLGNQSASPSVKGAISLAIWQITDPTPGDVPRDAAAQPYVEQAINAYNLGQLSPAEFSNSLIFVPDNPGIQSFMVSAPMTGAPEPGSFVLILTGVGLIGMGSVRLRKRKR